jgi:hypothetical protein
VPRPCRLVRTRAGFLAGVFTPKGEFARAPGEEMNWICCFQLLSVDRADCDGKIQTLTRNPGAGAPSCHDSGCRSYGILSTIIAVM